MDSFESKTWKTLSGHRSQLISERLSHISPVKKEQVRTKMQIAVNLDETLAAKGWKRTQLAKALGVKLSQIGDN